MGRRMLRATLILAAALAALPAAAHAATPQRWTLAAPGGALEATVAARGGKLTLTARRAGRLVVRARLGRATGRVEAVRRDRRSETFRTPAGKRRVHRIDARRLRLAFPRRSLELLVAADGVAVRARGAHRGTVRWAAAAGSRAWLQPLQLQLRGALPRGAAARGAPAALRVPGAGAHAGRRRRAADGVGTAARRRGGPPRAGGPRPARRAPVGGARDRPDVVAPRGDRLAGHRRRLRPPARARRALADRRHVVDQAGPRGVVVVGGLVEPAAAAGPARPRRRAPRPRAGSTCSSTRAGTPHGSRSSSRTPPPAACGCCSGRTGGTSRPRGARLGARPDGGLGRRRGQARLPRVRPARRIGFMAAAARAAARRHLIVSFHGVTVPRGLERTWPNVLTYEGVLGAEHAKSGAPIDAGARRRPRLHAQRDRPDGLHARRALGARAALDGGAPAGAGDRLRVGPAELRRRAGRATRRTRRRSSCSPRRPPPGTTRGCSRASRAGFATVARRAGPRVVRGRRSPRPRRARRRVRLGFLGAGAYTATVITDDGAGGLRRARGR